MRAGTGAVMHAGQAFRGSVLHWDCEHIAAWPACIEDHRMLESEGWG